MASLLAWRNLTHDRARFLVTMLGIVFSVMLITMQLGLFLGFADSTTTIIHHTHADLWILAKGTRNFEITVPIQERELYAARSMAGVAHAEPLMVQFIPWKKPSGGDESILLVGFDLNTGLAGPWQVAEGSVERLREPDTVIIDRLFADKLGIQAVGDRAEINQQRARVVGMTQGIRSFTTAPWVFTSFRTAQRMSNFEESRCNYVIVNLVPGADPLQVRDALRAALSRADVYTTAELADLTRDYWMFTTGAGASVLVSAVLGLLVGAVIVAQVLYATTVDHLTEFGTLRAMGAPRRFVYQVILGQALISATLGHLGGSAVAMALAKGSEATTAVVLAPPHLVASLFLVTLVMCLGASFISIRKAMTIDPAMVFQR